ncbi:MAG: hypothetical protein ACXVCS_20725, partial [Bdellovibrionota bacterium]
AWWGGFDSKSRIIARDSTYYYLVHSYSVALGRFPEYFPHPGLPLQAAGGILAAVKHFVFPETTKPFRDELIEFHEVYLSWMANFLILCNAAFLGWAGWNALRRIPIWAVCLVQLSFFLCPFNWAYVGLYQPECTMIALGSWYWISLNARRRRWLWLPAFVGTAISVKLLFVGYAASLFSLRPRRKILVSAIFAVAVLQAWYLLLFPFWKSAMEFALEMAARKGDYTSGGVGLPGFSLTLQRLKENLFPPDDPFFLVLAVLLIAFFCVGLTARGQKRLKRLFITTGFVLLSSFAIFLRKQTHYYYILPTFAAIPAFLFLFFQLNRKRSFWVLLATLTLIPLPFLSRLHRSFFVYARTMTAGMADRARTYEKALHTGEGCFVVAAPVVPLGIPALDMGSEWSQTLYWRDALRHKYPKHFFIENEDTVRSFSSECVSLSSWLNAFRPSCVLFEAVPPLGRSFQLLRKGASSDEVLVSDKYLEMHLLRYEQR